MATTQQDVNNAEADMLAKATLLISAKAAAQTTAADVSAAEQTWVDAWSAYQTAVTAQVNGTGTQAQTDAAQAAMDAALANAVQVGNNYRNGAALLATAQTNYTSAVTLYHTKGHNLIYGA